MNQRDERAGRLLNPGVIAVVRAQSESQVVPLSEALISGGINAIEITMTTPNAIACIRSVKEVIGDRGLVGVGTVLTGSVAREAIDAGAEFVVSPITRAEIVKAAHERDRPVMLGAYTPTECQTAYELGSDFIKLFPADGLGPAYVKAIRAPLPHLKIVPTGGVDLDTIGPFLKAGCVAVGAGSSLLKPEILRAGAWEDLTRLAGAFVEAAVQARRA